MLYQYDVFIFFIFTRKNKMKLLFTFLILFISNISLAGEKKTTIDRLQEADTVPVYIAHGKVFSDAYNAQYGKIGLTDAEIRKDRVHGIMPAAIDTLQEGLIEKLRTEFDTKKFVFIMSGSHDEIKNDIKEKGYDFVIVMNFQAKYGYEYINPKVRREVVGTYNILVAHRKLSGVGNVGFYQPKEKNNDLKNLGDVGGFVYDNSTFEVRGYTHDALKLMQMRDPMILKDRLKVHMENSISKLAAKLNKKHEKALSKRK